VLPARVSRKSSVAIRTVMGLDLGEKKRALVVLGGNGQVLARR
jgi:hypothetical protein